MMMQFQTLYETLSQNKVGRFCIILPLTATQYRELSILEFKDNHIECPIEIHCNRSQLETHLNLPTSVTTKGVLF